VRLRIVRKVESSRSDPMRSFVMLSGENVWRMRVGDYRVVADISLGERTIEIIAVGHRKNIYR
jgi:mRNA interferase RelE/StbE